MSRVLRLGASRIAFEVRSYFRQPDTLSFTFLFPVLMLAIFATAFSSQEFGPPGEEISAAAYYLPGMLAAGILLSGLQNLGVDIAVDTARLWSTLGFWRSSDGSDDGERDSFHIHGVTGPDEYTTVVNDNLFTNVMARFNLRFAARTVRAVTHLDVSGDDCATAADALADCLAAA